MSRVLVVDDAAFMRMMIKNILIKNGFEVVGEAVNVVKTLEIYIREKLDVVTMNIKMPDLDGIETVKTIKSFDPNPKIIVCSAVG